MSHRAMMRRMITQRARLRRTAVGIGVAAVAVLGLGAPAPTAALDEFPPPVASVVDGYGPEALTYACDDETYSWTYLDGAVLVMLDRPADADLTVPIAYGGSLAGDLVEPVPDLVFAPGDDAQVVPFLFDELVDGDLTVSIEPGADHQLGIPASITFDVSSEPESVGDCEDDLGDPPGGTDRQTISVGEKPDPIGFFPESDDDEADDGPDDLVVPDAVADRVRVASRADVPSDFGYTTLAVGELPPGLAYADDVWLSLIHI